MLYLVLGISTSIIAQNEYLGYRIFVINMNAVNNESDASEVKVDVVNTGKEDIDLSNESLHQKLLYNYNPAIEAMVLNQFQSKFESSFPMSGLNLKVGEMKTGLRVKLKAQVSGHEEKNFNVDVKQKDAPKKEKEGGVFSFLKPKKKEADTPTDSNADEIKEEEGIVFTTPVFESTPLDSILERKRKCSDLVIDTIRVLQLNKKQAVLKLQITNKGKGPARIYDMEGPVEENLGIRAFISGTNVLSKGALVVGGDFIQAGLEESQGILSPNQTFEATLEFDIRKRTQYLSVLILSLDAYSKLNECDRTNNTKSIVLQ